MYTRRTICKTAYLLNKSRDLLLTRSLSVFTSGVVNLLLRFMKVLDDWFVPVFFCSPYLLSPSDRDQPRPLV